MNLVNADRAPLVSGYTMIESQLSYEVRGRNGDNRGYWPDLFYESTYEPKIG